MIGSETDRVDASVLGAWQSNDRGGQGLFFDVDDSIGAYGAWFTYSLLGGFHPGEQRWYTLVQDADAPGVDPSRVSFVIYRNSGGQFAAAPATQGERVGSASLHVIGCDRALYSYRFDAGFESGVGASIPLTRAAPATRSCVGNPDATTAASAARGLDPRSSGAWYDAAAPGPGLAFDLRPPQDSDPGLFGGAWFTYDPEGKSDDPTSQHWFTLAGDLSGAADGEFSVPIYRTFGGTLGGEPTNNTWQVGTATLTFSACDSASLQYLFDQNEIAGAFAGLSGAIMLQRVASCSD
jgi:hypothetical protein